MALSDHPPEPMTPPDCDLRDYVWMPIDVRRLLSSETWVLETPEVKCAAFTLWCQSWQEVPAGSLPDNEKMLSHLAMAGSRWKFIRDGALRGWVKCADGRLYHRVVSEKAREAWATKQAQRARTKAARLAKAERFGTRSTGANAPVTASPGDEATDPVTSRVATPVATPVTVPAAENVTASNRTEQTRTELSRTELSRTDLYSEAPPLPPAAPSPLWVEGLSILRRMTGKPEASCRAQIGRWRKTLGDDDALLFGIITECRNLAVADPIAWIERAIQQRTGRGKPPGRAGGGDWMAAAWRADAGNLPLQESPTIDGEIA